MANIERKWFISYYHQKVQELIPAVIMYEDYYFVQKYEENIMII